MPSPRSPARPVGPRVVAVGPGPGDAVLSAGGVLARLADAGADVLVVTCSAGTGVAPGEDDAALAALSPPDGPAIRGVALAPAGTGRPHTAASLAGALAAHLGVADAVLAPQAIGGDPDHRLVARVVGGMVDPEILLWWRDVPAVLHDPDAPGDPEIEGRPVAVDIGSVLDRKIAAARSYAGRGEVADALAALALAEGARLGRDGTDEVLRAAPSPGLALLRIDRGAPRPLAPLGD